MQVRGTQSWVCRGIRRGNGRKPARREGRVVDPMPEDLAAGNARLRRESQGLRNTNELLKAASVFHIQTRPKTLEMIRFNDESRSIFLLSSSARR